MLSPALAGTRRACRAGEKSSHLCVYAWDMSLQRPYGAQKQKSWSLLARHLYTRQLAREHQKEVQPISQASYFSVFVRNGTKKRPVLSRPEFHMQATAFAVPLCKDTQC